MAPVSTKDKFPSEGEFDETVNVKVGTEPNVEIFVLHQGVLSFYSGFFAAAFKQDTFIEGRKKLVELPEVDVTLFRKFVRWLYIRQIEEPTGTSLKPFCEMWAFADRREIPLLMNTMIDRLVGRCHRDGIVPTISLAYIYENTTAGAGLRRLAIKLVSQWAVPTLAAEHKDEWPADASWDMMMAMWELKDKAVARNLSQEDVRDLELCEFHCHEEGARCVKR